MATAGPHLLLALALVALKERPIEWDIAEFLRMVAPRADSEAEGSEAQGTLHDLRKEITRLKRRCGELELQLDARSAPGAGQGDDQEDPCLSRPSPASIAAKIGNLKLSDKLNAFAGDTSMLKSELSLAVGDAVGSLLRRLGADGLDEEIGRNNVSGGSTDPSSFREIMADVVRGTCRVEGVGPESDDDRSDT